MRVIYINEKKYNGEMLPIELDNLVSNVCDMYEDLPIEEKRKGFEWGEIKIIEE